MATNLADNMIGRVAARLGTGPIIAMGGAPLYAFADLANRWKPALGFPQPLISGGNMKQSTALRVPVRLVTYAGVGITGVAYSAVTVYLQKQAGSSTVKTMSGSDWFELDATHFPGWYDLLISSSDSDTVGFLKYSVAATASWAIPYYDCVEVVANIASDIYARTDVATSSRLATGTVASDVTAIKAKTDNLPANTATAISAIPTTDNTSNISAIKTKTDNLPASPASQTNLDVAISTRLASASYTAPDNTSITAIKAKTDNLPSNPASQTNLDVAVSTRLATAGYTAPSNSDISAIKTKTDNLPSNTATAISAIPTTDNTSAISAIKAKTDHLPADTSDVLDDLAADIAGISGGGDAPSADTIAAAVLDKALSGHTTAGTAGEALSRLDVAVSSRLGD